MVIYSKVERRDNMNIREMIYEGGMGKPEYRGSHAYKEREDSK